VGGQGPSRPGSSSAGRPSGDSIFSGQPILEPGFLLGQRYEIISLLGEGGMGAVYKARDLELNRTIALKTIRREYAGNPAIIERFKQELILSTQVTHRNVVRIYDLGEAEGLKFITMEYVEGEDLRTLIHLRKKLPADEAVEIIQQVCKALEAAHAVGVIHRDLKPQNVMRDQNGRILVMDFGLARTLEGDGMTQTGALVGTMEYMSPEQALSKSLDQRSDIFSLGLIFYELLTGETPFRADSALASLIKRTQERAVPVSHHDSSISGPLDRIVNRCLERDVNARYQTAAELYTDLQRWKGKSSSGSTMAPTVLYRPDMRVWLRMHRWWLAGGGAAVLVLVFAAYLGLRPNHAKRPAKEQAAAAAAAVPAMSLAILPFRNSSGDEKDDWIGLSVAEMLSTDIGQSAQLRAVPSDRLRQVFTDLRIGPQTVIDPDTLRRVAEFSNADVVVSGQYAHYGDQIRIDATIRDLKHDQSVPIKAQALPKDLPAAIDQLAEAVRQNLSLSPDVMKELKAQSFKPASTSIDALRDYNQGLALMRAGKNLDALKRFQSATTEDPQFALAHSRLAEVQTELGFVSDAEESSRRAVDLSRSENLPLPEQYLISASHARIMKNNKDAIEAYENLAKSWPGDVDVQYSLGTLYISNGDYTRARDIFAKILQADPKNIKALWEMGVVENTLGNPQAALDSLSKGYNLATQVDNQEQKALILLSTGISYRLLNKPDEALRNYKESIAINEKIGQKRGVAAALDELANLQQMSGETDAALASYAKALALQREIGMKEETGFTLLDMGTAYQNRGDYDQALARYKEALQIQREIGDQGGEALCLTNIGAVYLSKGDMDNSFTNFQQGLQLREKLGVPGDISRTLEGLGEAYTHTGQYDLALKSLLRALDLARKVGDDRSVALVSHQIGLVFEFQGRLGAAVKSMQDGVKAFRDQGESGNAMASFQNDLAGALAQAGRGNEAAQPLDEAQAIAHGLKNDALTASILNTRGDVAFYKGDLKGAEPLYQSALRLATRAKDNDTLVQSKLNVARMAIALGRSKDALGMLHPLLSSDGTVSAYLSLRSAIAVSEAEVAGKDYAHAQRDLEQNLTATEKAGMRLDMARINYLLGTSARLSGSPDRTQVAYHYAEAMRLLDAIKSDPGAENILQRSDLKAIYDDANRWK
jgi:tetratricopeptide (TPR) repeat protein/predicted Ser/Thr protein kinase